MILTSEQCVEHPFNSRNTQQQLCLYYLMNHLHLYVCEKYFRKTKPDLRHQNANTLSGEPCTSYQQPGYTSDLAVPAAGRVSIPGQLSAATATRFSLICRPAHLMVD